MYQILLTKQAEKSFHFIMKSQPKFGLRIAKALDLLAQEPHRGVALRGELKGLFKYRVGIYRIIYQWKKSKLIITIIDIGHRKDVYR